ncbi:HAMP domain-containing histidine kinase (plasmid) [Agrobacterium sp. 33MFTa1.1]|uniref:sensor histidine kinase n=1 Tax=Agrobacterium TaxID=357 RepID=UPI000AF0CC89|nr:MULTISPECIES: HAMP domain-containing sensor histidine kinase [unclassified Agrobacterium]MBA8801165.1 signal transduction histidine kinase [Agrobacterium sp. RC10-4-1]QBJ16809.1 HAMP domain-containing histidine kinase [Agrobacterium sp. 33MFTa1.1]
MNMTTFPNDNLDPTCLREMSRRLKELEVSEARYRTLFNNVPAAVLQVDASDVEEAFTNLKHSGVEDIDAFLVENPQLVDQANNSVIVRGVNDVALTLFGATDISQLLAPVAYVFAGTPEASSNVMSAHFRGRPNHYQRLKIKTFDGRTIDAALMVSFPQSAANFDTSVLMIIDMTEQVRIERELKKMESEFAHFSKLSILGEFSGAIVHEVRQPLSVVANDAATAARWLQRSDPNLPKVRELVGRIEESVRRANEVIKRVQDMASKAVPERQTCDLNRLIAGALTFVKKEATRRSVTISSNLSAEIATVEVDPVQIQQLIVNLVVNAMQAIERTQAQFGRVEVTTRSDGERAFIEVHDTGPGIPEGIATEIFESFFTTRKEGMGMGLSICRSIVHSHGGVISARNTFEGGASFEAWLPLVFVETGYDDAPETVAGRQLAE